MTDNKKKSTKKPKKGGKGKEKAQAAAPLARAPRLTKLERMILDPCNAPLFSVYSEQMGGGHVFRVRSRLRLRQAAANDSGFLAWFPSYHNGGADGTTLTVGVSNAGRGGANLFVFNTNSTSTRPVNTTGATTGTPFGTGTSVTSLQGRAIADPAFATINSGYIAEARTLGACARVMYTGATSAKAGEVFVIEDFTQAMLMAADGTVPSIDELLPNASRTIRTPDSLEVVWRPKLDSEYPRKQGEEASSVSDFVALEDSFADSPFNLGIPAVAGTLTQISSDSAPGQPSGICIVYTGQSTSTSNDLFVELTKIVQVKYRPVKGFVEEPSALPPGEIMETSAQATARLDKVVPGWTVRSVADNIKSAAEVMQDVVMGGLSTLRTVQDVIGARHANPVLKALSYL